MPWPTCTRDVCSRWTSFTSAGVSQTFRSVVVLVVFSVFLLVTRNLPVSCIAMAAVAVATFLFLTLPLSLFESPKSRKASLGSIASLFKQCFPLFVALFMYNLIDNMPKFVMEGVLSYDNQLYFNALYFPAHGILLTAGFVYKPLTIRMAEAWHDPAKRRKFDIIVVAMFAMVVALTLVMVLIMGSVGLPVMSFLYGLDFEQFRGLCFIMLAAGGVTAAIEFLYQVITVLRRQKSVMRLYLITFGFSALRARAAGELHRAAGRGHRLPHHHVHPVRAADQRVHQHQNGFAKERADEAPASDEASARRMRPSEVRAERERRERVHEKRDARPHAPVSEETLDLAGRGRHAAWDDDQPVKK